MPSQSESLMKDSSKIQNAQKGLLVGGSEKIPVFHSERKTHGVQVGIVEQTSFLF
jgi:hypothetical protein